MMWVMGQPTTLRGETVTLVPVTTDHEPDLRRIVRTPEVRARWGDEPDGNGWPLDDPTLTRFAVLVGTTVAGMVQYAEELDPMYRHAGIDIFIDPAVHGRGIGRDAVRTVARRLVHDLGHHRLV